MVHQIVRRNWLLLLAALLLAACGTAAPPPATLDSASLPVHAALDELPTPATFRIGLNTEVTGTGAQIGDLTVRAARLAVEEINGAGGIGGVPLELVVRDSRSDPATALAAYQAAVRDDNLVALIGPLKSAHMVLMVPEHRRTNVPLLFGATNRHLTEGDSHGLFRMRPSDALTAAAMTALAVDRLGARQIAVIHDSDAFGSGGAENISGELARRNLSPPLFAPYTTGAREFDTLVQQVAEQRPDAVLVYATNATDMGALLRSIRYWNLEVPIITSPSGASPVARNIAAQAQDGVYVAMDTLFAASKPGQRFEQTFRQRFGLQADTYVAWVYDSVYLLADVLRQGHTTPEQISAALHGGEFVGAQGVYRFDGRGEGLHKVVLAQMGGGVPTQIGLYTTAGLQEAQP